jgi:hypothetical protein
MRPTRFELATFGLKGRGAFAWGVGSRRRCDLDETPSASGSCSDARVRNPPGVDQRILQIIERRTRELVARKGEDTARQETPSRDEGKRSPRLLQDRAVVAALGNLLREVHRSASPPELAVGMGPCVLLGHVGDGLTDDAQVEQHTAVPARPMGEVVPPSQLRPESINVIGIKVDVCKGRSVMRNEVAPMAW